MGRLFISYKFVKGFLAITFLLLVFFLAFNMCVNVFYITRNNISVGSDKKREIFPETTITKIAHFCNVMTLQKWTILRILSGALLTCIGIHTITLYVSYFPQLILYLLLQWYPSHPECEEGDICRSVHGKCRGS